MAYERRYCGSAAKTRYPDRPAAETALRHLLMDPARPRTPLSTYACDVCGGWHLTSRAGSDADGAGVGARPSRPQRPVGASVRFVRR